MYSGNKREERLGKEKFNNQGYLMKIIEYNRAKDIVVEFQDKYGAKIHTEYKHFLSGGIKNPYHPDKYGGMIGIKYSSRKNGKKIKEYNTWCNILKRCYDEKCKKKNPTYKKVTCCEEWLLFENFYNWLHSQENFEKWLNGEDWAIDKDILIKGNKIYSPDTCCLVPKNVNNLFIKNDANRCSTYIGVYKTYETYFSLCQGKYLGSYQTPEEAFYMGYKSYKENLIKQVAQKEYYEGNIIKACYEAMMNYKVEIDD